MKNHRLLQAFLWMVGWVVAITVTNTLMKILSDLPRSLTIGIKSILECIFLFPVVWQSSGHRIPSKANLRWYLLRAVVTYLAMQCTYLAYAELPLSTVVSIGFIEPSILIVLSTVFFKLSIHPIQWFFVLLGYVGVLLIKSPTASTEMLTMIGVALLANLLAAFVRLITKHLTTKTTTNELLFYGKLFFLPISILSALPYITTPVTLYQLAILLLLSFFSFSARYCYIQALSRTHFDIVGPMTYMKLLLVLPVGYYFFNDTITVRILVGSLLILGSNYATIVMKWEQKPKEEGLERGGRKVEKV